MAVESVWNIDDTTPADAAAVADGLTLTRFFLERDVLAGRRDISPHRRLESEATAVPDVLMDY